MPIIRSAMASLGRMLTLAFASGTPRYKPAATLVGHQPVRVEQHRNGKLVPVYPGRDRRIALALERDRARPPGWFNGHTKAWRRARAAGAR